MKTILEVRRGIALGVSTNNRINKIEPFTSSVLPRTFHTPNLRIIIHTNFTPPSQTSDSVLPLKNQVRSKILF